MNTVAINSLQRRINKTKTLITSLSGVHLTFPLCHSMSLLFFWASQTTSAFSNAISSDAHGEEPQWF